MTTVAELLIEALAEHGVRSVWGVVGDALNPVTDAIRREDRIEWVGVRHEEAGAFAAGAQAQLTGRLGVCMGTVGPGALHLLNGLYDAAKSHAPVLAICGQVPREEIGSDFFQEVDNDAVFADVAVFRATVTTAEQFPGLLEQAVNTALAEQGVAVLSIPGDVGGLDVPKGTPTPRFVEPATPAGAVRRQPAGGGRRDRRRRRGHAAGRAGRPARPRGGAAARRPPLRADGAHPQGQGGLRGRQRLRDRPVRADRQPRHGRRVRAVRRAGDARHRLPLQGLPPDGQDRRPARRAQRPRRTTYGGRPRPGGGHPARPPAAAAPAGREAGPRPPRQGPVVLRELAGASAAPHRPGLRPEAQGPAAPHGRQPRPDGCVPSCSRPPSTGTPTPTRCSPPTPGWRPCGCRGSCG